MYSLALSLSLARNSDIWASPIIASDRSLREAKKIAATTTKLFFGTLSCITLLMGDDADVDRDFDMGHNLKTSRKNRLRRQRNFGQNGVMHRGNSGSEW